VDNNYLIRDLDSLKNFIKEEKPEEEKYFKLELTKAPEPTDIIWENLFMEEDQINTRMWIVTGILFVVIGVAFAFMYWITG